MAGASQLGPISPFFIVADVPASVAFYTQRLGFELRFAEPATLPFFAVIGRDAAQIFLKSEAGIAPVPNRTRHAHLPWDAFVYVEEPDALHADIVSRGAICVRSTGDTQDGLRGFEIDDPDGYRLFFGWPR